MPLRRAEAVPSRRAKGAPRSLAPLVVVLILVGTFGAAIGVAQITDLSLPGFDGFNWRDGGGHRSAPTRISIPAADVAARVVEVGRADDGSIDTPRGDPVRTTGWYGFGPSPGDPGTAVIVGHVDTKKRPAVFQRLHDLRAGARIEVTRRDRVTAAFTVDSIERYPKTAFPANKVFAPTPRPRLALVTCGGAWLGGSVGYADNVIVFATQV